MKSDRFVRKRVTKIGLLTFATLLFTLLMGVRVGIALDEALVLLIFDIFFLFVLVYFLEEERVFDRLPRKDGNDFSNIALWFLLGMAGYYFCSYLPEYSSIALVFSLIMSYVANRELALIMGIYMSLISALTMKWDIHVLAFSILLTILGVVLKKAAKKKHLQLWVHFLLVFGTIIIVITCYYTQYLVVKEEILILAAAEGALNVVALQIAHKLLEPRLIIYEEMSYMSLIDQKYPLVKAIKRFSEADYSHALRVSAICGECAKLLGLNEDLCRVGGFYYRLGRMGGEPYIENGVAIAENSCFPKDLVQILSEYNGELHPITTKESAVVHMVDKVVTKLDVFDKQTFSTNWNQDMVIYQTLNEISATGIYDESGLGMNQFLSIRDFLVKGDHLF